MRFLPYTVEIKSARDGVGWIPAIDTDSNEPERVANALRANGMRWILATREWRVVPNQRIAVDADDPPRD